MRLNPNKWFQNVVVVAAEGINRETVQYVSNIYKYYLAYRTLLCLHDKREFEMSTSLPEITKADRGTILALERTDFAAERTLMAWIRTSLSMISFGFTIYKFFQYIVDSKVVDLSARPQGPRNLGLALITLGTVVLAVATVQHWMFLKKLSRETGKKYSISLALVTALLISLLGIVVFLNLLFRVGPF
jgi:inner membrane protein YidH